jgi:hypothetical protein
LWGESGRLRRRRWKAELGVRGSFGAGVDIVDAAVALIVGVKKKVDELYGCFITLVYKRSKQSEHVCAIWFAAQLGPAVSTIQTGRGM